MKRCSKCKSKKSLSEFGKQLKGKDGLRAKCKKCRQIASRIYYRTHKIEKAKYLRKYRKTFKGYLRLRFQAIRQRCTNPKATAYKYYGGRGIKCKFKNADEFITYVINKLQIDLHGLEVDRINSNGHYEPGNIRIVTHIENLKNKGK